MKDYTIGDLLLDIAKGESLSSLFERYNGISDKECLLNGIFKCVVALRSDSLFANASYLIGNSNKRITTLHNVRREFLDTFVNNSYGNGISDCSYEIENTLYLSSYKYYEKEKEKSIDIYDIDGLFQLWKSRYSMRYKELRINLFVRNRIKFMEMLQHSNKKNMYKDMISNVFGSEEIEHMICRIYEMFKWGGIITSQDIEDFICNMLDISRMHIVLQPHQKIVISRTLEIEDNTNHKYPEPILWAMLPGSGKYYMTAGHILESIHRGKTSFLVITSIPNESIIQLKQDIFDKFVEFANIDIVIGADIPRYINMHKDQKRPYVIIMSKQIDELFQKVHSTGIMKGINFDVIYFNENHHGGMIDLSRTMVHAYKDENTQIVLLTASDHKPHHLWNLSEKNIVRWE